MKYSLLLLVPCAAACAVPPRTPAVLRVCTFGGEGKCSRGLGDLSHDTLAFLSPLDGPAVVSCSCLARCDRGVAVKLPDGEIDTGINGPQKCAALLRTMGHSVDQRLVVEHQ